jgi:glyoxylase I family protein
MPTATGIHHISLTASNQQRSIDWYRDLLGLEKVLEGAHPDGTGSGVVLADPEFRLLISIHGHSHNSGEPFTESRTGLDHAAIGVPDRSALVEWQERLDSKGIPHSPIKDEPYGSLIVFRDPDNIQLEFFAPPAR